MPDEKITSIHGATWPLKTINEKLATRGLRLVVQAEKVDPNVVGDVFVESLDGKEFYWSPIPDGPIT